MAAGSAKRRQLMQMVAQMTKMLEGLELHGDKLPEGLEIGGERLSVAELKASLQARIKTMLEMQETVDKSEAELLRLVEARGAALRVARAKLGDEILAEHGIARPKGGGTRHTKGARQAPKKKR
jgi:hypothetical protein